MSSTVVVTYQQYQDQDQQYLDQQYLDQQYQDQQYQDQQYQDQQYQYPQYLDQQYLDQQYQDQQYQYPQYLDQEPCVEEPCVEEPKSAYSIKCGLQNKVKIQKFENILSILKRKTKRLELSSDILLKSSHKILEKKDKLYSNFKFVEKLYFKNKDQKLTQKQQKQKQKQQKQQNEDDYKLNELYEFSSSGIMMKMQREMNVSILYNENERILLENEKIQMKLYAKNNKISRIEEKYYFVNEMNELQEFIYKTKSKMKSVSVINLDRLSLLPAELILIIRDYLPIQVRTQVLENTWNIPYIEFNTNKIYENDTMTNLILIMSHCQGNEVFCNHPVFLSVFKNYRCNRRNNSLYYYTIMFDALILLLKSFYPKLAYKVLTLIKQNKLHKLKELLIRDQLNVLYPTWFSY